MARSAHTHRVTVESVTLAKEYSVKFPGDYAAIIGGDPIKEQAFIDAFVQGLRDHGIDTSQLNVEMVIPGSIIVVFSSMDPAIAGDVEAVVDSFELIVEIEGRRLTAASFGSTSGSGSSGMCFTRELLSFHRSSVMHHSSSCVRTYL